MNFRPQRYYKRKNAPPPDIVSRVQITLLEYGFRGGEKSKQLSRTEKDDSQKDHDQSSGIEENDQVYLLVLILNLFYMVCSKIFISSSQQQHVFLFALCDLCILCFCFFRAILNNFWLI